MEEKCVKCNSQKIIPRAKVIDRGDYSVEGDLSVAIDENPGALLFKERIRSNVTARICGACGFTELFADEPGLIYAAYLNQQSQ